jgi:hypothetical protein
MTGTADRMDQMSLRVLAVLATRSDATVEDVLGVVARDEDERCLALLALGGLVASKAIAFVNGWRDVPLASIQVRMIPV